MSIKNLHEGADIGKMLHTVPLNTVLPANNLRHRCWPAPVGLFFEAEELRLRCGGASRTSPCSAARAPTPRPWHTSDPLRYGAYSRPGPLRRSSAHVAACRRRIAAGRQLKGTAKITNTNGATCLSLVWWLWWLWWLWLLWFGHVCISGVSVRYERTGMHLTMGAVCLWTRLPVSTCVQRSKNLPPHPSCQDRQLELVAAATQRRRQPQKMHLWPLMLHTNGHVNDQVQEAGSHNCARTAGPARPTTTTWVRVHVHGEIP